MEEQSVVPSKVLHIRNLPPDVTEGELSVLGTPFGQVVNILLLKAKNQGFIELSDSTTASRMVNYYISVPATIRSKLLLFFNVRLSFYLIIGVEMCTFNIQNIRS